MRISKTKFLSFKPLFLGLAACLLFTGCLQLRSSGSGANATGSSGSSSGSGIGSGFSALHAFTGTTYAAGFTAQGGLLLSGGKLYGVAQTGGTHNQGTIYSCNTDGSSLSALYSFTNGNDGGEPVGSLIVSGSVLYGMTYRGGASSNGTIFSFDTSTSTLTTLYSFTGGADGKSPLAGLTLSGTTLYGTAYLGGASASGTLFSFDLSTSTFTTLYAFSGSSGIYPQSAPILSGTILYGTAEGSGGSSVGTLYSFDLSTSTFTTLHSFSGASDGSWPYGSLILSGGILYGATNAGGTNNGGTLFSYNIGTSTFTSLYSFTNGSDGGDLQNGLILSGSVLYGTTAAFGASNHGVVFSFDIGTSTLTTLHSFTGGSDGSAPFCNLILSGSTLYGVTGGGGTDNAGEVFSYDTGTSTFAALTSFPGAGEGGSPIGTLLLSGNTLYGLTEEGGALNYGTIFSFNISTSTLTTLHSFTGESDGYYPINSLILSGTKLYGTTSSGGAGSNGTLFSFDTSTSTFSTLYAFTGGSDGGAPQSNLTLSGSILYGTTETAGATGYGTIFSFNTGTSTLTTLYSFTGGSDGGNPYSSLILSGTILYGTTPNDGAGHGTIFSFDTGTSTFTTLYSFTNGSDGAQPYGSLILSGTTLYGMAEYAGANGAGTIFSFDTGTSTFTSLYSFTSASDGANPYGGLLLSGNKLYGMAQNGGANNDGTVFSFDLGTSTFTNLYTFSAAGDGAGPDGSLILSGNTLYGMTDWGNTNDGTLFEFGL